MSDDVSPLNFNENEAKKVEQLSALYFALFYAIAIKLAECT